MSSGSDILSCQNTTLAILAGGEGARMGKPKAGLELGSKLILDYLLDALEWPGPTMLVTAPHREHPPAWNRFSLEVCDPAPGGGPLRGILTALEAVQTQLMLVLTVDMPMIRRPHCELLLGHLRLHASLLGVVWQRMAHLNDRHDGLQIEPFPIALRSSARDVICRRLAERRKSVHGLLEEPGFVALDSPRQWEQHVWTNLNTPADLASFQGHVILQRS